MTIFSGDLPMLLIMGAVLFCTFAFRAWGKSKGKTSVHAADESLNDIAVSAIGNLFDAGPDRVIGGKTVFRAPWGARLLLGPILLTFVLSVYLGTKSYHADSLFLPGAIWVLGAFVIFQWMMILFVTKIVVDGETITSHGYSLRPRTRKLEEATGIAVDPETNLLTISFRNQKPLRAPRFLSGKAELVALVEAHIKGTASGAPQSRASADFADLRHQGQAAQF